MIVIGILSAVAIPRMVNMAKEARKNTILAIANSFRTSVELMHNQWIAMSEPDVITTMDGVEIFMRNTVGYPRNVGNTMSDILTDEDCVNLWNALLKNPPLASTTDNCTLNGTCKYKAFSSGTPGYEACNFIDKDYNSIYYDTEPNYNGLVDVWIDNEQRWIYYP